MKHWAVVLCQTQNGSHFYSIFLGSKTTFTCSFEASSAHAAIQIGWLSCSILVQLTAKRNFNFCCVGVENKHHRCAVVAAKSTLTGKFESEIFTKFACTCPPTSHMYDIVSFIWTTSSLMWYVTIGEASTGSCQRQKKRCCFGCFQSADPCLLASCAMSFYRIVTLVSSLYRQNVVLFKQTIFRAVPWRMRLVERAKPSNTQKIYPVGGNYWIFDNHRMLSSLM